MNFVIAAIAFAFAGNGIPGLAQLAMWTAIGTIGLLVNIVFWSMLIVVIISWVNMMAPVNNPLIFLLQELVEPFLKPFRRLMPDLGGLDLSPILLLLSIQVIEILLFNLAVAARMTTYAQQIIIGI